MWLPKKFLIIFLEKFSQGYSLGLMHFRLVCSTQKNTHIISLLCCPNSRDASWWFFAHLTHPWQPIDLVTMWHIPSFVGHPPLFGRHLRWSLLLLYLVTLHPLPALPNLEKGQKETFLKPSSLVPKWTALTLESWTPTTSAYGVSFQPFHTCTLCSLIGGQTGDGKTTGLMIGVQLASSRNQLSKAVQHYWQSLLEFSK